MGANNPRTSFIMPQLFLFDSQNDEEIDNSTNTDSQEESEIIDGVTKICRICKKNKPVGDFYLDRGAVYSKCKECSREYDKGLAAAKKTAPPKPKNNLCECCGTEVTQWFCDHYPNSELFRGWVCRNCNTAAGLVGDTHDGAVKLFNYLYNRKNAVE